MQVNLNAASGTQTSSGFASTASGNLGDQFMTLLLAELKTQDPISPVDPTQMVGQMVSLNQLNELIQIHQLLQTDITTTKQ